MVHDGVRAVVVGELRMRDLISPGTRVRSVENPKICFNLLVDTFCFAVGLKVVGSGKREVVVKELSELFGEGRCELWTLVRDDFIIESKVEVDFVGEEWLPPQW